MRKENRNRHLTLNVNIELRVTSVESTTLTASFSDTLSIATERFLQRVACSRSTSTMNNYKTAIRSFSDYLGADILLADISSDTLCGFERWLRQRGVGQNTSSCYMRSLRAVLTGCDKRLKTLFGQVFTGKVRTVKRSTSVEAIAQLRSLALQPHSFLNLARDIFLFSFYAMGMPFVDVAHLRWSQVGNDAIVYHRQKTGQRIAVALEPVMRQFIDHYRQRSINGDRCADAFVFPLLATGTDHEYQIALGRYNRALRRLREMAQIEAKLTSYVPRHTWASIAYHSNIELAVISKALGHTNPQTTLTYIREIDDIRLAEANQRIIGLLDNESGKGQKQ